MKHGWHVCVFALLLGIGLFGASTWAWDGDWTDAVSGKGDMIYDPDNSQGKAGTDPPQKFLTPNPRDYADVDPDELDDYYHRHNKDYAPYALARITQDLHYNNLVVPKGYYLVKPGNGNAGSPKVNLKTLNASTNKVGAALSSQPEEQADSGQLPPMQPMSSTTPATLSQAIPESTYNTAAAQPVPQSNSLKTNKNAPVYEVFVLKRQGKVIGVVPINRMESYQPPKDQKIPKQALAWIEIEDRHPVLKFYFKKWLYCTDFQ